MTIRKAKEINKTMKIIATGEDSIAFKEMQVVIKGIEDVDTKFGIKAKAVLENQAEDLTFDVFLNNFSMQNLIDAYGEDDSSWVGQIVDLKKEIDGMYKKEMIVLHPVK